MEIINIGGVFMHSYENNVYLLFPLKVFEVRKKINKIEKMNRQNVEYDVLITEVKDDILRVSKEILEHIEIVYKENKIDDSEFNEFGVVIANLTQYLCQEIDKLDHVKEEVGEMIKTFYDPKVEQRGIEKGIKLTAENMLKDGEPIDKIKRYTGLNEEVINDLKKAIDVKGEH
jgi:hypothetical protein